MSLREVKFVLESNDTLSTRVLVDESSTVYDAMSQSGLLPRDGSLRYAMDKNGNSLNHQIIRNAPTTIQLGVLKRVESIWGETNMKGPFTGTECLNGTKLLIPGIRLEITPVYSLRPEHKNRAPMRIVFERKESLIKMETSFLYKRQKTVTLYFFLILKQDWRTSK